MKFILITFIIVSNFCFSQNDKLNFSNNEGEVPFAIIEDVPLFFEC